VLTEERREQKIQRKFKEYLKDFTSDHFPKRGIDYDKVKEEGYDSANDEFVTDMEEFAKSAKTVDMNPDRFKCILSSTSVKQKTLKR